jgi:hypothetical protein
MTPVTRTRRNEDGLQTPADEVVVIVGETINASCPQSMPTSIDRMGTDSVPALPLNLVRRRLWWRRDRLVVVTERHQIGRTT